MLRVPVEDRRMPAVSAPETSDRRAAAPSGRSPRIAPTWSLAARVGLGVAVLLGAGLASADGPAPSYPTCTKKPTAADIQGAKGAHSAAVRFYERGDYDRAIQYWRDAYTFDCTAHGVLINIANAYEKKGDKQAAIVTLETYLARGGADPTLEERVANLRKSLKPSAASPAAPASSSAAPTAAQPAPTAAPAATGTPDAPPPAVEGKRSITPWFVVGGGAVAAIAGAILLPVGSGAVSSAESQCPDRQHLAGLPQTGPANCPSDVASKGNSGRTEVTAGAVLLGVGGAAIVGGLVWQFAFNKPKPATGFVVQPALGPGQAGLGVAGAF
jgi:hypothetical protein